MQALWRIRNAIETILGAALIVLLLYGTFWLALAGAWVGELPVPWLALVSDSYTRERYLAARGQSKREVR